MFLLPPNALGVSRRSGHTCTYCVCVVRCVRHEVAVARQSPT
jgi:hypothetical protein